LFLLALILGFAVGQTWSESMPKQVLRRQVAELARNLVGIPYRFGGVDIDGFDCSGLVYYVHDCFGISLPRSAREQGRLDGAVPLQRAAAGDILVFKIGRLWHSAIYLGDGRFVHSPNAGGWVRIEILNEYWASRLRRAIRL
jgi:cell wall-associated NlpC family hydrolase